MSTYIRITSGCPLMYSHTLWIELGCQLLPFGFAQRSELPRKDGRQDMSKGLGTACQSLQLCATAFCLVLSPYLGIQSFILWSDLWESFSILVFFKIVCSEGFKRQTSSTSPCFAWQGGFCAGLLHPWALEGPLVESLQVGRHKCT